MFEDADIIHAYTRADAIRDGVLIDISQTAREAGLTVPVAMTKAAWEDCVAWTKETQARKGFTGQNESGRLWDVVNMTRYAAARTTGSTAIVGLFRVPPTGDDIEARYTQLHANIGPGDNGEPVIVICLPYEDL